MKSFSDLKSFVKLNPHTNLFPIVKEFNADLETPVSAFLKISHQCSESFLLESVEGGERVARYSFIGTEPYKVLVQDGKGDPLIEIEKELSQFSVASFPGLPFFTGGGVGYIGYECVKYFEPTVNFDHQSNPLELPESIFMFTNSLVLFDHVKHTIKIVSHVKTYKSITDEELEKQYVLAVERINILCSRLDGPIPKINRAKLVPNKLESQINVGPEGYVNFVNSLKKNIVKGDIIQAVPSQRIKRTLNNANAFDIYRQLRVINPSPYLFYLNFGGFQVVGASPELLVKVENNVVTNHPIAGTRRRGKTPEEDKAMEDELLSSEKERAEHIMLVDLGRNDVGRIAKPGTVNVDSLMLVEKYSHVMHIVSHVSGILDKGLTAYDAFRSVFPAGTVSGAPKIRAMQLVSALESENRNIYAGAVGCISYEGVMETCIAIRTMVVKDGYAYLQAGGGIVYDSIPEEERMESIHKMKALARAIDVAEESVLHQSQLNISPSTRSGTFIEDNLTGNDDKFSLPSYFGSYGGTYVGETLVAPLKELEYQYLEAMKDPEFFREFDNLNKNYVGRPTPLYFAKRLTDHCGGCRIWLKREDLAHTGAHKINNALGSCLLAKRLGKTRVIAETGAGQHGVAVATACALLNLDCHVYMGEEDIKRQALNVFRMKMLGADVIPVTAGTRTLKDAVSEAIRDWVLNTLTTFYCIGSVVGPHPYPAMVRNFQSIIGRECKIQMKEQCGKLPDIVVACVGGGSNAIGIFNEFVKDKSVRLIGVEAAGLGLHTNKHSASITAGSPGVLHGMRTYLLQDENGQITDAHSISAGLDYPAVGPEHCYLHESGRAQYVAVTDDEALQGLRDLTRLEGIIPALESSHAVFHAMKIARDLPKDLDLVINVSGRGDKDMPQIAKRGILGEQFSFE